MRMLTLALVLLCGGVARGEWLVDGPWIAHQDRAGYGIGRFDKHGVKFSITADTIIDSIEGRIYLRSDSDDVAPDQGNLRWSVYANGADDFPSQPLLSQDFFVQEAPAGRYDHDWHGIYGPGWTLPSGTYWAVLEQVDGIYSEGGIQGTSLREQPPAYDFANQIPVGDIDFPETVVWTWFPSTRFNVGNLGIRVAGHAVPEPSGAVLACVAIAALAFKGRFTEKRAPIAIDSISRG